MDEKQCGVVPGKGFGLRWRVHKSLIFSRSVLVALLMTRIC